MKTKLLIFLTIIACIASFCVGAYIANPFPKEVVDLKDFTEYYENDLIETGGWEVQNDNFYTFKKVYKLDKIKKEEENTIPEKQEYIVVAGDNLTRIAENHGIQLGVLEYLNPKVSSNLLKIGQKLVIINENGIFYKVEKGDTLDSIAKHYKVEKEDIIKINKLDVEKPLNVGDEIYIKDPNLRTFINKQIIRRKSNDKKAMGFIMPIKYSGISSPFGNRFHPVLKRYIYHSGVDLRARFIPVYASKSGTVSYAGIMRGYGKIIIITHSNGYETRYAHLDKIGVRKGSYIRRGELIGKTGQSGRVTGPHLHFEIRKNGKALNPMRFVSRN